MKEVAIDCALNKSGNVFDEEIKEFDKCIKPDDDQENLKKLWELRAFPRKFFRNYYNPKISYSNKKLFAIAGNNQIVANRKRETGIESETKRIK